MRCKGKTSCYYDSSSRKTILLHIPAVKYFKQKKKKRQLHFSFILSGSTTENSFNYLPTGYI